MSRRQDPKRRKSPWPRIWLMTDERFGDELLPAIQRLPFGSGVIFRHYRLSPEARRRLFLDVRKICHRRGHMLFLAGPERLALKWQADGCHDRKDRRSSQLPRSAPVHDRRELRDAKLRLADLLLISPLFPTASHPAQKSLGRMAFNSLARQGRPLAIIALGGVSAAKARTLDAALTQGWAGIDAFRKAKN